MRRILKCFNNNVIWFLGVTVVFCVIVAPFIYLSFFGTIAQDDFSMLLRLSRIDADSFIRRELIMLKDLYMDWQGAYFTNILFAPFLIPFYRAGNIIIQLEMFFGVSFYLLSFFYMLYKLIGTIFNMRTDRYVISMMVLSLCFSIIIFHSLCVKDVFYWITGMLAYLIPLSFAFISVAVMVDEKQNWFKYVIGVIFSFLSSGGSPNIAAFSCFVTMVIAIFMLCRYRRFGRESIVFLAALIGAFINVCAPGNYVRYKGTPGSKDVFTALFNSIKAVIDRYKSLSSLLLFFVCTLILIIYVYKNDTVIQKMHQIRFVNPITFLIVVFLGETIIDFPVFLGAGFLSMRNVFISKNAFSLFTMLFIIDTVGFFEVKYNLSRIYKRSIMHTVLVFAFAVLVLYIYTDKKPDVVPYVVVNDIIEGKQLDYVRANNYVLDSINNTNGGDLVIEVENYPIIDYMKGMGVNEDPENWVNRYIRDLYGFDSVSIIYK